MSDQKDKQPDFEQALTELEKLVEQLEAGDLSLDESLQRFKHGIELTRHCQGILSQAQQTVEKLNNAGDELSAVPFEAGD